MSKETEVLEEKQEQEQSEIETDETPETPLDESSEKPEETEDESTEESEDDTRFKPRFTQFASDDPLEYAKKLEAAYYNSSLEGQRLSSEQKKMAEEMEVIKKIVSSDEELRNKFAEKLGNKDYDEPLNVDEMTPAQLRNMIKDVLSETLPATLSENPALQSIEREKQDRDREVYNSFTQAHPELQTDPILSQDFETAFGSIAAIQNKKGEKVDFAATLEKAWKVVSGGKEMSGIKKQALRDSAAMSGTSGSGGRPTSKELSPAEKEIAKKLGLSEDAYLKGKAMADDSEELEI